MQVCTTYSLGGGRLHVEREFERETQKMLPDAKRNIDVALRRMLTRPYTDT